MKKIDCLKEYPPTVTRDGRERRVRNLGWLVRHEAEVKHITLRTRLREADFQGGAWLICWLERGGCFSSGFASAAVCKEWLARRRGLRGVTVHLDPPHTVNASDYFAAEKCGCQAQIITGKPMFAES